MKYLQAILVLTLASGFYSCGDKNDVLDVGGEKTGIKISAIDQKNRMVLSLDKKGEYSDIQIKTFMRESEEGQLITVGFPWEDSLGKFVYNRNIAPYYLQLYVVGITKNGFADTSNVLEFFHPEYAPISTKAFNVAYSPNAKKLYFLGRTTIGLYDLTTYKMSRKVEVGVEAGYGNVGFNGQITELYIPGKDGNLYIYNGATLDLIDKIPVGYPCFSVVAEKGFLFIATGHSGFGVKPIKVYNRATKALVSTAGANAGARLFIVPGIPNPAIYELTTNVWPGQVYIHYFGPDGQFLNTIQGDKRSDFIANGQVAGLISNYKFIVSTAGVVYDRVHMTQENSLSPIPNKFRSFYFHQPTNQLYAARMEERMVDKYSYPGFNTISSFKTVYLPEWIFNVDGKILSVGTKYGLYDPEPTDHFYLEFLD